MTRRIDGGKVLLTLWGVLVFGFLFLPIVTIVVASFNEGRYIQTFEEFGFGSFANVFDRPLITEAIWNSIQAAVGASVLATVLGTLAGIALGTRPGKWAPVFIGLLMVTMVTPEIVDAIALLPWFVTLGVDGGLTFFNNGIVRLVAGHTVFATAVVTFIVRARVSSLDERLDEAAADLYAGAWNRFRQITIPLVMPAVVAGAMMSFALSLDNTIISAFVSVPGSTPFPVYVFSAVRSGLRPEVGAAATLMLVLTLAVMALAWAVLRRASGSSQAAARTMAGG